MDRSVAETFGYSDNEIDDFYDHFKRLDRDGDGRITQIDLSIILKEMGLRPNHKHVLQLIKEVDANKSGHVEFEEFVKLMYRLKKGGTTNWKHILDYTKANNKDLTIAKSATMRTIKFFGATSAADFEQDEQWQNHSFFERIDGPKPKEKEKEKGKGKGKEKEKGKKEKEKDKKKKSHDGKKKKDRVELEEVVVDDDDEVAANSDSSFEYYSDSDQENFVQSSQPHQPRQPPKKQNKPVKPLASNSSNDVLDEEQREKRREIQRRLQLQQKRDLDEQRRRSEFMEQQRRSFLSSSAQEQLFISTDFSSPSLNIPDERISRAYPSPASSVGSESPLITEAEEPRVLSFYAGTLQEEEEIDALGPPPPYRKKKPISEQNKPQRRQIKKKDKKKSSGNTILMDPKVRSQLAKIKYHRPYFITIVIFVQLAMLAYELILNNQIYGKPIEEMDLNPFAGPAASTIVLLGAKYAPCMRPSTNAELNHFGVNSTDQIIGCPGTGVEFTSNSNSSSCTFYEALEIICGMGGFSDGVPNQWWRFFTAMFVHVGVIHVAIIIVFQIRFAMRMESEMGSIRIACIYIISGLLGNGFSANMAPLQINCGASGPLFGLFALLFIDLFQNWPLLVSPKRHLFVLTVICLLTLSIGLLPFIDNYAQLGGFAGGILSGLIFMPTITFGIWDGRTKKILLGISIPILIVLLFAAFYTFYDGKETTICEYCSYLDCVPPKAAWCSGLTGYF